MRHIHSAILPAKRKQSTASRVSTAKKRITRSRPMLSCETCKTRRVKCDKEHPACNQCRRTLRSCIYKEDSSTEHEMPTSEDRNFWQSTSSFHCQVVQESKHHSGPALQSLVTDRHEGYSTSDKSIELQLDHLLSLLQVLYDEKREENDRYGIGREKRIRKECQGEDQLVRTDKVGLFQLILDAIQSMEPIIQDRLQREKQESSRRFSLDECYLHSETSMPDAPSLIYHRRVDGGIAADLLEANRHTHNISEPSSTEISSNKCEARSDEFKMSAPTTHNSSPFVTSIHDSYTAASGQPLNISLDGEFNGSDTNLGWQDWDAFFEQHAPLGPLV